MEAHPTSKPVGQTGNLNFRPKVAFKKMNLDLPSSPATPIIPSLTPADYDDINDDYGENGNLEISKQRYVLGTDNVRSPTQSSYLSNLKDSQHD